MNYPLYPEAVQKQLDTLYPTPNAPLPLAPPPSTEPKTVPPSALDEPDVSVPAWMQSFPDMQTSLAALALGGAVLLGGSALVGEDIAPPSALGITALMVISAGVGASPFVLGQQQAKRRSQDCRRELARERQESKQRINQYVSEVETLQDALQVQKQTAIDIGDEALRIRAELNNRTQSTASQQTQITELTQSLTTASNTIATLRNQISDLQAENEEYDDTVGQWETDFNVRVQAEIANIQSSHTLDFQKLKRQMDDELEAKQLELLQAKRQIETQAEQEIQQIKNQYSNQTKSEYAQYYADQINDLHADIAELESANAQLSQQLSLMQERMLPIADVEQAINERSAMLDHTISETEKLSSMCENLESALAATQSKLTKALLPVSFCPNSDYTPGNVLINYLHEEHGLIFDAVERTQSSGKDTYWMRYRGNSDQTPHRPYSAIKNGFNLVRDDFAIHLDVKSIGELSYHQSKDLFSVAITSRHAKIDSREIERHWIGRNRFKSVISPVRSLRATAGSEGGKSPLIRNVLGAKLANGEQFKLYRFDTSAFSKKDFWRIAPTWHNYDDANNVAIHMMDTFNHRKQETKNGVNQWEHTIYYAIDEFDNVVANGPDTGVKKLIKSMLTIFKEGSHLGIGILATGQNPNSSIWGVQRAEFNNVWNIHIGDNYHDAIANSNRQSGTTDLSLQFEAITQYAETQNKKVADITRMCRFGLLQIPTQSPKFLELPFLGSQGFDKELGSGDYEFASWDGTQYPESVRSLDDALIYNRRQKIAIVGDELSSEDESGSFGLAQNSPQDSPKQAQNSPSENHQPNSSNPDLSTMPTILGNSAPKRPMQGVCPACQNPSTRYKGMSSSGKFRFSCTNDLCSKTSFSVAAQTPQN